MSQILHAACADGIELFRMTSQRLYDRSSIPFKKNVLGWREAIILY
jgi:hypothetical protein